MKIRATHHVLTADEARRIFEFVRLPGCERVTVKVKNTRHTWGGRACLRERVLLVKMTKDPSRFPLCYRPYQYGQFKGKTYPVASMTELAVVIMAHEARHFWQHRSRSRRGYIWGARGRYSEVDTEAYAIRTLRAWRRSPHAA